MRGCRGAVIFDMDGTLCDSSRSITQSINYVRSTLELEPLSVEQVTYYINLPDCDLPKLFYGSDEYKKENRDIFVAHYEKNCINGLVLYEGISSVLEELDREFDMAVATNASDFFAETMLSHLNIRHFFKKIIGANTVGQGKPNPTMIDVILDEFNCDKRKSVFVGDSKKDQMAAKNASIDFVHVKWGFGKCEKPDYEASDSKELLSVLQNRF